MYQENKQAAEATSQEGSQDYSANYFQDSQLPDEEMNIEEIKEKVKFCTTVHPDEEARMFEEAEERLEEAELRKTREAYECPDDHYGCCDEHMLEFEMDH